MWIRHRRRRGMRLGHVRPLARWPPRHCGRNDETWTSEGRTLSKNGTSGRDNMLRRSADITRLNMLAEIVVHMPNNRISILLSKASIRSLAWDMRDLSILARLFRTMVALLVKVIQHSWGVGRESPWFDNGGLVVRP